MCSLIVTTKGVDKLDCGKRLCVNSMLYVRKPEIRTVCPKPPMGFAIPPPTGSGR